MTAGARGLRRPGIRLLAGAAVFLASAAVLGASALYALGAWFQFSEPPRPADCIVVNPEFEETPEQLLEKYNSLHG